MDSLNCKTERAHAVDARACACMGPMYGEPHCYCRMVSSGMPLNAEDRAKAAARAQAQLQSLFSHNGQGANAAAQ